VQENPSVSVTESKTKMFGLVLLFFEFGPIFFFFFCFLNLIIFLFFF